MDIAGTEIVNLMPMAFRQNFAAAVTYGGGLSGLCSMLQTIGGRIEANPNSVLTEEEADYVNLMVRAAWRYGVASYGNDPNQWNERAKKELLETKLPYMSTLDGFGSLDEQKDITHPALRCVEEGQSSRRRANPTRSTFGSMTSIDPCPSCPSASQSTRTARTVCATTTSGRRANSIRRRCREKRSRKSRQRQ